MELAEGLRLDRLRCAAVHRAAEVDPAGTAPVWDAVLVVEIPGPWPRDISEAEPFASLVAVPSPIIEGSDGRRWRPQGVRPEGPDGFVRVMAFERPVAGAGPFSRREWLLPGADPGTVVGLLQGLVGADPEVVSGFDDWRDDPEGDVVDLLLCTHGTRDVCCGSSGPALHAEIVGLLGGTTATAPDGGSVRVWRTSHAGGHRFAPTAVSLPEGVSWSHLDLELVEAVLRRRGGTADLGPHWRGSVTVEGAPAQVADREAFVHYGWDWLKAERTAIAVAHDRRTLATTVDVLGRMGDGADADAGMRVEVEVDRHVATPTCGGAEAPEFTTETVWRVVRSEPLAD